jgi:hypothetical protein
MIGSYYIIIFTPIYLYLRKGNVFLLDSVKITVTIQKPDLSGIQIVINQTQFVSSFQIIGTILFSEGFWMDQIA